jgi:hypothetical protein
VVDYNSIAHHFSDDEHHEFFSRAGKAGIEFVRMLLCWQRPAGRPSILPFKVSDGLADWDEPNSDWDENLHRIQRIAAQYGVGIWLDLFAQQFDRADYLWSPFRFNRNGFDSYMSVKPEAIERFKGLIDRCALAIGKKGNVFGWGNEIVSPWDYLGDVPEQDEWARAWVLPLANHMKAKGIPMPIPFSAGNPQGTGKSIYNRLTKQADPLWLHSDTFWVLHGLALKEHFDRLEFPSALKHYGISDDGIGLSPENTVPPEKQGLTVNQTGRHSSHWTHRIELVRAAHERLGERLRCVEIMPMELKWEMWKPGDLHQEESVDVFWRIAQSVYGVDIRRDV